MTLAGRPHKWGRVPRTVLRQGPGSAPQADFFSALRHLPALFSEPLAPACIYSPA